MTKYFYNNFCRSTHEKDFFCEPCQKRFTSSAGLKGHVKAVHKNQRDHKCHLCEKGFTKRSRLLNHVKSAHDRTKDFECETCGKMFTLKSILSEHIKSTTMGPSPPVPSATKCSAREVASKTMSRLFTRKYENLFVKFVAGLSVRSAR